MSTFRPAGSRPASRRSTARVVLIDEHDRLLLLADSDSLLPDRRYWITPGGGIDEGESPAETAIRELFEETGLVLPPDQLRGPVACRTAVHAFSDVIVDQSEIFFTARVPAFVVSTAGHTEDELRTLTGWHWFTCEEMRALADPVWPGGIEQLWEIADAWLPGTAPVDLGHAEESTVPDDR